MTLARPLGQSEQRGQRDHKVGKPGRGRGSGTTSGATAGRTALQGTATGRSSVTRSPVIRPVTGLIIVVRADAADWVSFFVFVGGWQAASVAFAAGAISAARTG